MPCSLRALVSVLVSGPCWLLLVMDYVCSGTLCLLVNTTPAQCVSARQGLGVV